MLMDLIDFPHSSDGSLRSEGSDSPELFAGSTPLSPTCNDMLDSVVHDNRGGVECRDPCGDDSVYEADSGREDSTSSPGRADTAAGVDGSAASDASGVTLEDASRVEANPQAETSVASSDFYTALTDPTTAATSLVRTEMMSLSALRMSVSADRFGSSTTPSRTGVAPAAPAAPAASQAASLSDPCTETLLSPPASRSDGATPPATAQPPSAIKEPRLPAHDRGTGARAVPLLEAEGRGTVETVGVEGRRHGADSQQSAGEATPPVGPPRLPGSSAAAAGKVWQHTHSSLDHASVNRGTPASHSVCDTDDSRVTPLVPRIVTAASRSNTSGGRFGLEQPSLNGSFPASLTLRSDEPATRTARGTGHWQRDEPPSSTPPAPGWRSREQPRSSLRLSERAALLPFPRCPADWDGRRLADSALRHHWAAHSGLFTATAGTADPLKVAPISASEPQLLLAGLPRPVELIERRFCRLEALQLLLRGEVEQEWSEDLRAIARWGGDGRAPPYSPVPAPKPTHGAADTSREEWRPRWRELLPSPLRSGEFSARSSSLSLSAAGDKARDRSPGPCYFSAPLQCLVSANLRLTPSTEGDAACPYPIRDGDRVVSVEGRRLRSLADLQRWEHSLTVQREARGQTVVIARGARQLVLQVASPETSR